MEEKKNFWHTARDLVMGAAAVVLTAVGAKYVAEKIQQDKKQQTSEWRSGKVNGASVTYDKNSGFILTACGSRKQLESLGSHLSQKQMDSLDAENIKHLNERVSQHTWHATASDNPKDMRITIEGKNYDFGDLADAVRNKSENLQQKKNGTDTPESKVADDKNKEAVLPKQPQIKSTRSKGGRKGGEPLGA